MAIAVKQANTEMAIMERREERAFEKQVQLDTMEQLRASWDALEYMNALDAVTKAELTAKMRAASGLTCTALPAAPQPASNQQLRLSGEAVGLHVAPAPPPVIADLASKYTLSEAVHTFLPGLQKEAKPSKGEMGTLGKAITKVFKDQHAGSTPDQVNGSKKAEVDAATGQSKGYSAYWYTGAQVQALLPSIKSELCKLADKREAERRGSERAAKTSIAAALRGEAPA